MAQLFDPGSAQPAGDVFPIAEGVGLTTNASYAPATVSDNGVLVYAKGGSGANQIAWYDRSGKLLSPVGSPGSSSILPSHRIGNRWYFGVAAPQEPIYWLRDLARGTETRFTSDVSVNNTPFWSPKGDRIVFASNRNGGVYDLFQKAASGSGQDEALLTNGNTKLVSQWSRDGRFIVYYESNRKNKYEIWVLPMEGPAEERKPVPYLQVSEFSELMAQLSPDGHWMAYTSDQSGRWEVYVRRFPRAERQWIISGAGGEAPRWRGDGKELFFEAQDGKMMAVEVKVAAGPMPKRV